MTPRPKWTVLSNLVTTGSPWVGTSWEFFDDEIAAQKRYDELVQFGHCPCKRPYYNSHDQQHLGAVHTMSEPTSNDCSIADSGKLRFYLDTEFIEDGKTLDLISIGIVCEDGREYYAVSSNAQLHRADDWVRANVLTHLPPYGSPLWRSRNQIALDVQSFVLGSLSNPPRPEFWAYYADYDWVVLCQLFGRMIDLPKGFPMFCMDLKQLSVMKGSPEHPKQVVGEHDALADAPNATRVPRERMRMNINCPQAFRTNRRIGPW